MRKGSIVLGTLAVAVAATAIGLAVAHGGKAHVAVPPSTTAQQHSTATTSTSRYSTATTSTSPRHRHTTTTLPVATTTSPATTTTLPVATSTPHRHTTTTLPVATTGVRPSTPTSTPYQHRRTPPTTGTFSVAAIAATNTEAGYAEAAWCGPLQVASGHPLTTLLSAVAAQVGKLALQGAPGLVTTLSPVTGQVRLSPTVTVLHGVDLATADAIVPTSPAVQANSILHTTYCLAAPAPLTTYQASHGATGTVDFEVAYGITSKARTTWWHLWFQLSPGFAPCAANVACIATWDASNAPVPYWAAQQRSTRPQYVIEGPLGTWELITPGEKLASPPHKGIRSSHHEKG